MKDNFIFVTFFLVLLCSSNGLSQSYSLLITNEPYDTLIGGTPLVSNSWDDPAFVVPIGFGFHFFGDVMDSLYSIDFFSGEFLFTNPNLSVLNSIVAFSTDLIDRGYEIDSSMSPILYKTEGGIGQRVFTLEFKNAGFHSGETQNGIYTDYINFQLKIHEENSSIEVHIGPYSVANPGLDFEGFTGPVIGLVEGYDFENDTILGELFLLAGNPLNPDIITDESPGFIQWPIPVNTLYTFNHIPTSINEVKIAKYVNYYVPNPTSGKVFLIPESLKNVLSPIKVFNSSGILVLTKNNTDVLDMESLTPGIYELLFQTTLGINIQRISIIR